MESMEFEDRSVFVAGGSSGINLGIAIAFAKAGARLAILSRSAEKIEAAVGDIERAGGRGALGYAADVRRVDEVASALRAAHDAHGPIDVLVSGAAGNFPALAKDLSPNGFKAVVDIDLLGTFNVLRSGFEFLRKPGASIINISAPQAANAMPAQAHVCAAKAGVDMLTRVLAIEWAEFGIRVNSLMPGPVRDTEGMRRLAPTPEATAFVAESVPLGRLANVDDIAAGALMLASSRARFVTGVVLPVDGGWSLGGDRIAMAAVAGSLARGPSGS